MQLRPLTPRRRQDLSSHLAAHQYPKFKQTYPILETYLPSESNPDTTRETAKDARLRLAFLVLLGARCVVLYGDGGCSRGSNGRRLARRGLEAKTTSVRAVQYSNNFCNIRKTKKNKIACQEAGRLTAVSQPAQGILDSEGNRCSGGKVY